MHLRKLIIKCALKNSNSDSPISKNLMFTTLASNTSSSSTKTLLAFLDLPLSFHHTPNIGFWPQLTIQLTTTS
ncbi:hypothetical protein H5410_002776 [Solanum commersonii]|uniref:Uncharacterized protein n=1 Tax=Solanum commersonii TaxID=4109 RepID=A0A9J6B372_SOLCO|nr:hypothetical protein H5410_002776 [Solanum commersonii]